MGHPRVAWPDGLEHPGGGPSAAPVDFVSLARMRSASANWHDDEEDVAIIRSILEMPFHKVLLEDLHEACVEPLRRLASALRWRRSARRRKAHRRS